MAKSENIENQRSFEKEGRNPFVSAVRWIRDKIGSLSQDSSPKSDEDDSAKPQTADSRKESEEEMDRRAWLRKVGQLSKGAVALVAFTAIGLGDAKDAHADYEDPPYQGMRDTEKKNLEGSSHPEKLTDTEIGIMDTAMNSIFRHYLQTSFLSFSLPIGASKEVKEVLEIAIKYYDELHYKINKDGEYEITKRKSNKPSSHIPENFMIIIRRVGKDYIITKVNRHKVNLRALTKWQAERNEVQEEIEVTTRKIFKPGSRITETDLLKYENYSMVLPRKFRDLLVLKQTAFGLNAEETRVLNELNTLLTNHPQTKEEMSGGKQINFFVIRWPKAAPNPTPANMVEFIYPQRDLDRQYQTFAAFSFDGFVMEDANRPPQGRLNLRERHARVTGQRAVRPVAWKKSSGSFADLHREKIRRSTTVIPPAGGTSI